MSKLEMIIKGYCFDIYKYQKKQYVLISKKNTIVIQVDNEVKEICRFPYLEHTADLIWNSNKDYFLIANTLGKCLVYNAQNDAIVDKLYLSSEPFKNSFVSDNNTFFIANSGKLWCYNIYLKEIAEAKLNNIGKIIKSNVYIYNFFNNIGESKTTVDIIELNNLQKIKSIEINVGTVFRLKEDIYNKYIYLYTHYPHGEGYIYKLYVFSIPDNKIIDELIISNFENEDDSYFVNYSFNSKNGYAALLWENKLKIIDMKSKTIVLSEKFKYASDVDWIDENQLLVATWNGLYSFSLS